eukprot:4559133-Pleurochrysis_carterae.AAC.2
MVEAGQYLATSKSGNKVRRAGWGYGGSDVAPEWRRLKTEGSMYRSSAGWEIAYTRRCTSHSRARNHPVSAPCGGICMHSRWQRTKQAISDRELRCLPELKHK